MAIFEALRAGVRQPQHDEYDDASSHELG
jgi:hypothetical protein